MDRPTRFFIRNHQDRVTPGGSRRAWLVILGGITLFANSPFEARATEKEQYVNSVITLLRLHADAIRQLSTHDFKYSRNLARHATALQNAFGLLGPMEWHVSTSTTLQKQSSQAAALKAEDFEKMAEQCQKSMKGLYQAAIRHVDSGGNAEPVLKSLDELQGKCTSCHSLLDGVAPDVWGNTSKHK